MDSRRTRYRFSLGSVLFLVLGFALGIVVDDYLVALMGSQASPPATQSFYVCGAVVSPGEYEFVQPLSLMEGLTRAGGLGDAAGNQLKLTRRVPGGAQEVTLLDLRKSKRLASEELLPDDVLEVVPNRDASEQ